MISPFRRGVCGVWFLALLFLLCFYSFKCNVSLIRADVMNEMRTSKHRDKVRAEVECQGFVKVNRRLGDAFLPGTH